MKTLKWETFDNENYVSSHKNFVFTLEKKSIGVYSMGQAYILKVRHKEETKPTSLVSFWVYSDGGYNTYQKDGMGKKLWNNINEIKPVAEKTLKQLLYLE